MSQADAWYKNTTNKHMQDAFIAFGFIAGILRNGIETKEEETEFERKISPFLKDILWLLEAGADSIRRLQSIADHNPGFTENDKDD